jgi:hypothetical protein
MKLIMREPLVHFLLIGAGLFLVYSLSSKPVVAPQNRILVTPGQIEQMEAQFSRTWMRLPTKRELAVLIESYVRDEVYYREALAMGLDRNDANVRRQMRLKVEFLLEDLGAVETPGEDALAAYLKDHPDKFQEPPQISFQQIYLNPDKHPDMRTDAAEMLARLKAGEAVDTVATPTLVNAAYVNSTPGDVIRQFGEAFANEVFALPPGGWTGPLYSNLGGHLVQITARVGSRLPTLDEVRSQVEREYIAQRRERLKESTYHQMRANYDVIIKAEKVVVNKPGMVVAAIPQQGAVK